MKFGQIIAPFLSKLREYYGSHTYRSITLRVSQELSNILSNEKGDDDNGMNHKSIEQLIKQYANRIYEFLFRSTHSARSEPILLEEVLSNVPRWVRELVKNPYARLQLLPGSTPDELP